MSSWKKRRMMVWKSLKGLYHLIKIFKNILNLKDNHISWTSFSHVIFTCDKISINNNGRRRRETITEQDMHAIIEYDISSHIQIRQYIYHKSFVKLAYFLTMLEIVCLFIWTDSFLYTISPQPSLSPISHLRPISSACTRYLPYIDIPANRSFARLLVSLAPWLTSLRT
jgi:hypothetical protein